MADGHKTRTGWLLAAVIAIALVILIGWPDPIKTKIREAQQAENAQKWCDAKQRWQEVIELIDKSNNPPAYAEHRAAAEDKVKALAAPDKCPVPVAISPKACEEIANAHGEALRLHEVPDWPGAKAAWEKLLSLLDKNPDYSRCDPSYSTLREEAIKNMGIAETEVALKPVDTVKLPLLKNPREDAPADKVNAFYTKGRTIRSLAYFDITGTGSNKFWVFKIDARFAYRYRVMVETEVVENNGERIVFVQAFKDATQFRATSDRDIQLSLPDSPMLRTLWDELERKALARVPLYVAIKKAAQIVDIIDPNAKRLLTWFGEQLRARGIRIGDDDDVELVTEIGKLAGTRLQFEFVPGFGVQQIKRLEGNKFNEGELNRLAVNSSLLMDFFIDKVAHSQIGQPISVNVSDVAAMAVPNWDQDSRGELILKKQSQQNGESVLDFAGGEVTVSARIRGSNRTGHLKPVGGTVHYSADQQLVRRALIDWEANSYAFSDDHLLFGTENIRNAKIRTYYEAESTGPGQRAP